MPWLNPWVILGVLLAVLGSGAGGYIKGHRDADRSAEIAAVNRELATARASLLMVEAQARAAQDIAKEAAERQKAAEADIADMQAEIEDYARIVDGQKDCSCSFSADDVKRLRDIGAAPRRASPGPAGGPIRLRSAPGGVSPGR